MSETTLARQSARRASGESPEIGTSPLRPPINRPKSTTFLSKAQDHLYSRGTDVRNSSVMGEWANRESQDALIWLNGVLKKTRTVVNDLEKLGDGTTLPRIVEILTLKPVEGIHSHPAIKIQVVENVRKCLNAIEQSKVPLHGITAEDVVAGNLKTILALCHCLRLRYKVPEESQAMPPRSLSPTREAWVSEESSELENATSSTSNAVETTDEKAKRVEDRLSRLLNSPEVTGQKLEDGDYLVLPPPPLPETSPPSDLAPWPPDDDDVYIPSDPASDAQRPGYSATSPVSAMSLWNADLANLTSLIERRFLSQSVSPPPPREDPSLLHSFPGLRSRSLSPSRVSAQNNKDDAPLSQLVPPMRKLSPSKRTLPSQPGPTQTVNPLQQMGKMPKKTKSPKKNSASGKEASDKNLVSGQKIIKPVPIDMKRDQPAVELVEIKPAPPAEKNEVDQEGTEALIDRRREQAVVDSITALPSQDGEEVIKWKSRKGELIKKRKQSRHGSKTSISSRTSTASVPEILPTMLTLTESALASRPLNPVGNHLQLSHDNSDEDDGSSNSDDENEDMGPPSILSPTKEKFPLEPIAHPKPVSIDKMSASQLVAQISVANPNSSLTVLLGNLVSEINTLKKKQDELIRQFQSEKQLLRSQIHQQAKTIRKLSAGGIIAAKYGKQLRTAAKHFSSVESDVVKVARSSAQITAQLEFQTQLQHDVEILKESVQGESQLTDIYLSPHKPATSSVFPDAPKATAGKLSPSDLHSPQQIDKLKRFFGEEPPLLKHFLKKLGYAKLLSKFEKEKVTMLELPYLDEEKLIQIGIPIGPTARILAELEQIKQSAKQ